MNLEIHAHDKNKIKEFHYQFSISERTLLGLATLSLGIIAVMITSKNRKSKK